jgi:hypothetical protein
MFHKKREESLDIRWIYRRCNLWYDIYVGRLAGAALFLRPEGAMVSVDTYKQFVHYFTQKQLTNKKLCGIL